jgi:hypothetical protein
LPLLLRLLSVLTSLLLLSVLAPLLLLLSVLLPLLWLLLSVLPPLLLLLSLRSPFWPLVLALPAPGGVVLRRRRGLGEDHGSLRGVISLRRYKIIGGMGRSEAGKARQDGTCHQQMPELFHLISYGCGGRDRNRNERRSEANAPTPWLFH